MGNKRKRQRQAARRAAQKIEQTKQMDKDYKYKSYVVAVQKTDKSPIYVTTVKEKDREQLIPFICRLNEVKIADELAFLEIHEDRGLDGVGVVVDGGNWPTGVAVIHNKGFTVRGKVDERPLTVRSQFSGIRKPATRTPVATTTTAATTTAANVIPKEGGRFLRRFLVISAGDASG